MNWATLSHGTTAIKGFRPQQGLTIMNGIEREVIEMYKEFPSPTGVNYYESLPTKP